MTRPAPIRATSRHPAEGVPRPPIRGRNPPLRRPPCVARDDSSVSSAVGAAGLRGRFRSVADDQRGAYASFIAIIAAALLFLGGIAYDAPRLTAARQDALHAANEAARVAAATIASGGTVDDAEDAATDRLDLVPLIYGERITLDSLDCVGSRVQVTVASGYVFRSTMQILRDRQPIEATGAAEAYLVLPDDTPSELKYLGECPL